MASDHERQIVADDLAAAARALTVAARALEAAALALKGDEIAAATVRQADEIERLHEQHAFREAVKAAGDTFDDHDLPY